MIDATLLTPRDGPDAEFFEWLRTEDGGHCALAGDMGDGRYCAVKPLLFHWTMIVGVIGDRCSYEDRFCYADRTLAFSALLEWMTRGWKDEPIWWHRHPKSGRRRPDGDPAREYVAP